MKLEMVSCLPWCRSCASFWCCCLVPWLQSSHALGFARRRPAVSAWWPILSSMLKASWRSCRQDKLKQLNMLKLNEVPKLCLALFWWNFLAQDSFFLDRIAEVELMPSLLWGHTGAGWPRRFLWWLEHIVGTPGLFWYDEVPGVRLFCRLCFWFTTRLGRKSGDTTSSLSSFWSSCRSSILHSITTSWYNPHKDEPKGGACIFLLNRAGDLGGTRSSLPLHSDVKVCNFLMLSWWCVLPVECSFWLFLIVSLIVFVCVCFFLGF